MPPHDFFEYVMPAAFRRGDADIVDTPVRLHREERFQMRFPSDEVVNLQ